MGDLDILIITAADGEDDAVRLVDAGGLGAWVDADKPDGFGFSVWRRDFQTPGGRTIRVGLTKASQMGVEGSIYAASRLVPIYKPWCLAMCGVCAGRPDWANPGDVIVAEWVYRYDVGEQVATPDGKTTFRPDAQTYNLRPQWKQPVERYQPPADATWTAERPVPSEHQELWLLKQLLDGGDPQKSPDRPRRCRDWTKTLERLQRDKEIRLRGPKIELTSAGRKHIEEALVKHDGLPPQEPWAIRVGPLGTGSCLQRDLTIWDRLSDHQRRVVGLEMEASAIGKAAELEDVERMIVVKGVMDHAEPNRPQSFRAFAARAAAEVLIGFLRERFDEEGPARTALLTSNIWTAPEGAENPGTLLNARYEIVPFFDEPRAAELSELEKWCDDPNGPSVRLFIGPGGAGKTRLLIEFAKRRRAQNWEAGFLMDEVSDASDKTRPINAADLGPLLGAGRPTLVVIDYAESRIHLLELLKRIASDVDGKAASRASRPRVALLARHAGDWWESLKQQDARVEALLEAAAPRRLDPVPLDGALRAKVHAQAFDAFARQLDRGIKAPSRSLADPRFERVLYLHAAALLDVLGLPAAPDSILEKVLVHEQRLWSKQYRERHGAYPTDPKEFTTSAARTVAALTLRGGAADHEEAVAVNDRVTGPTENHFALFLHDLYPGAPASAAAPRYLAGLEPDLLGETLVRAVLLNPKTPARFLALAVRDDEFDPLRTAFTVLGRVALRDESNGNGWLARVLDENVVGRALPALLAALALGDESAHSRLGKLLADRLPPASQLGGLPALVERLVPERTVSLRELGAWALSGESGGADEEGLAERARQLNNLGNRLSELGRREEALAATREAVEIRRTLAAARPDAFLPNLAGSLNNLGAMLSGLGRREEALAATHEAVEIRRTLAAAWPDAFLPDLAMSLNNLGKVLSDLGRREEALAATHEAVEIRRTLAAARPDAFLPDLAASLNNLGNALSDLGRREEALAAAGEAVEHYRTLAAARPDAFLPDLAMSLNNLGKVLSELGRREEALAATGEAVEIRRTLAAARPDAFLPDLAMSLNNLGAVLSELGRREEALAATGEAVEHYRALAAARPDAFLPDLAMSLNNLGVRLIELGRREEALEATDEGTEHFRTLAAARPDAFLPDLATSLSNLGNALSELGRREEALAATREAVEIRRTLAAARPDAFLPNLAGSLNNLGAMLSELVRREEALAATREAAEHYRTLAAARPDAFLPDLAASLNNLGNDLSELGRREEALAATREAVEIHRALAAARPDAFLPDLAASLNNLGNRLSELGRREEALAATREAVEIRRTLAAARPDAFLPDLAMSLNNLGSDLSELGRREEALAATREAVEHTLPLVKKHTAAFIEPFMKRVANLLKRLEESGQDAEADPLVRACLELLRSAGVAQDSSQG